MLLTVLYLYVYDGAPAGDPTLRLISEHITVFALLKDPK